jgi:hypothetical protein
MRIAVPCWILLEFLAGNPPLRWIGGRAVDVYDFGLSFLSLTKTVTIYPSHQLYLGALQHLMQNGIASQAQGLTFVAPQSHQKAGVLAIKSQEPGRFAYVLGRGTFLLVSGLARWASVACRIRRRSEQDVSKVENQGAASKMDMMWQSLYRAEARAQRMMFGNNSKPAHTDGTPLIYEPAVGRYTVRSGIHRLTIDRMAVSRDNEEKALNHSQLPPDGCIKISCTALVGSMQAINDFLCKCRKRWTGFGRRKSYCMSQPGTIAANGVAGVPHGAVDLIRSTWRRIYGTESGPTFNNIWIESSSVFRKGFHGGKGYCSTAHQAPEIPAWLSPSPPNSNCRYSKWTCRRNGCLMMC